MAASTRDPWANTMEGKGIDFSFESLVSLADDHEDAMSEVSSECPSEYYCGYDSENQLGTAELPREKRIRG